MALTRDTLFALATIALFPMVSLAVSTADAATTKTKTQTIIVPLEETPEKPDAVEAEPTIPNDALPKLDSQPASNEAASEEESTEPAEGAEEPDIDIADDEAPPPLPPVLRDTDLLPAAVRTTHAKLISAAKRGDMEALRALIGTGETATTLSIGGLEGDPIAFLKETSGDEDGYELLAILLEVLEAGFVHVDAGTESEMYVWPYFFTWPFEKLTPQMKVELYRILTAGDVQDSADFGGYIFYRIGIRPDGRWDFFVAGD